MFWIVCYDIRNDKRRREVVKVLEGYGRRVQYSVFECEITLHQLERLEREMQLVINEDDDDVRIYPLNQADVERIRLLGRARLIRTASFRII